MQEPKVLFIEPLICQFQFFPIDSDFFLKLAMQFKFLLQADDKDCSFTINSFLDFLSHNHKAKVWGEKGRGTRRGGSATYGLWNPGYKNA